jgi:cytochrome c2
VADPRTGDGLWKWVLGGIAAGAAILGLMVGAYAIGYDRGEDSARTTAAETTPPPIATETTETEPTETETATTETTLSEAELLELGETLWGSTGCSGCHSLDGSEGVGPSVQGLAGSTVTLEDGTTVTADADYLARSITDPDAQISDGYQTGIMAGAVASQDFATRQQDVDALVAFIEAQG